MEPEIRSIRVMVLVLAAAVVCLGVGVVLYIRQVTSSVMNSSSSVWVAGQRRSALQTGLDAVLWLSLHSTAEQERVL